MSVWTVFINIIFLFGLFLVYKTGKRMEAVGDQSSRLDYLIVFLYGSSGIISFATCSQTMITNPVRGWTDAIIGLISISVSIWALTLYKRLKGA
jgi:hypothetical protein